MERFLHRAVFRDVAETATGGVGVRKDGRSPRVCRIGRVKLANEAKKSRYDRIMRIYDGPFRILPFDDAVCESGKYEARERERLSASTLSDEKGALGF